MRDGSRPRTWDGFVKKFNSSLRGPTASGCMEWVGRTVELGYGRVSWKRKSYFAHRIAWTLHNGPIPRGLFVCHKCDNPPCCNPEHLFIGTPKDNQVDCISKGRKPYVGGTRKSNARLTDDIVREIRASPSTQRELASKFGVTQSIIWLAKTGKTWKHVK